MNDFFARHRIRNLPAILPALFLFVSLSFPLSGGAQSRPNRPPASTPTQAEIAARQGDLKDLREQIERLRKSLAATEGQRSDATNQLRDVEREISSAQRELHELAQQRRQMETALRNLGNQSRELERGLARQQAKMEELVYRQYVHGYPDLLQIFLSGESPGQALRDVYYLSIIAKTRSGIQQEIEESLRHKQALATDIQEKTRNLANIEAQQKKQQSKFLAQRAQRKKILGSISAKITAQRQEIGNLQRNEQRLTQLVEQLSKILAQREAQRQAAQPPATRTGAQGGVRGQATPQAIPSGNFARLKGNLHPPAQGTVTNRFGATRPEGGTWKGLFIRAPQGSNITAIAAGQVVFADWMRGFGNLMILDHGNSYLSIYGNNEALLKQTGDIVKSGDVIASAGNSGGNPESGLYFELRYQGQSLDPMGWVKLR